MIDLGGVIGLTQISSTLASHAQIDILGRVVQFTWSVGVGELILVVLHCSWWSFTFATHRRSFVLCNLKIGREARFLLGVSNFEFVIEEIGFMIWRLHL